MSDYPADDYATERWSIVVVGRVVDAVVFLLLWGLCLLVAN